MRWCLLTIILLLGACSNSAEVATVTVPPTPMPPNVGSASAIITSPAGRYTAQLWRYDRFGTANGYISAFDITNVETGLTYRQRLSDVLPRLHQGHGGGSFQWTPSDNYLVITAEPMVSSHGCYDLFVYAGDGSALVHTLDMSECAGIMADWWVSVVDVCGNDDILFAIQYHEPARLSPATGEITENQGDTC
jgi:hypothetical protein